MAEIEYAPQGTRELLRDVANHLRVAEEAIVEKVKQRQEIVEADASEESVSTSKAVIVRLNEQLARIQRLVGRVDATLNAWDLSELTLDDAAALFESDPNAHNGDRYLAVAEQYGRDEMIGADEVETIRSKVEEARTPL